MTLWGNTDFLTVAGFTNGESLNVVGTASSEYWTAAGVGVTNIPTNAVIAFGDEATGQGRAGFAVVLGFDVDDTVDVVRITPNSCLTGAHNANLTTLPKYLVSDPRFNPNSALGERGYTARPVGVNTTLNNVTVGTQYEAGVGWIGITTYVEGGTGNLRVKTEVLVAASGIATASRPNYPNLD